MPDFASHDGVTLHYDDEGEGPLVVLLHGFAADSNINFVRSGIFDALADAGYRVVAFDALATDCRRSPLIPSATPARRSARTSARCSTTSERSRACCWASRWAGTPRST